MDKEGAGSSECVYFECVFFSQANYIGIAPRSQNDRYLDFYKIQGCFI